MKRDIIEFVYQCLNCQQVKYEHQRSDGMLQRMSIPERKWERIVMDFVVGLLKTLVQMTYNAEMLVKVYIREIIRLHGVPISIISDRGTQFMSHFWRTLQAEMGTQLDLSTAFHPQTDEFSYNNSYHSSIDMTPFEALYRRRCRSPIGWFDASEVLLKVSPMKGVMRFGKKGKLSLRFIGLFEILRSVGEIAYELALPLGSSGVHSVFHVLILKKYNLDGSYIIQWDSVLFDQNLADAEEPIAILDREVRKLRSNEIASMKVQWKHCPVEEAT
ncbi:uncharacterized protein LOC132041480 [Lycium ferocissimum]|uniref:uncharacterized protein LOC132041480 n=1 Tax=Lycium ferocissimum TaxID=112874 RepID=UPI0028149F90|nr:uncharacterized protein LOC132041480 [Lycium ferocissimum]